MTSTAATEIDLWSRVTDMLGDGRKRLGQQWSGRLQRDPVELALTLSWAKFAAKMACAHRSVLELACDEGIRSPMLSEFATQYVGVDSDAAAIATAQSNWDCPRRSFVAGKWLGHVQGAFQTVVCHDVRPFRHSGSYDQLVATVLANLDEDGLCVLGWRVDDVPNHAAGMTATADNAERLADAQRLAYACERTFRRVLRFGMTDGLVHAQCAQAADHMILLGICPRAKEGGRR